MNQFEIGLKLKQVYLSKTGSFKFTMNGMQSKTFLAFFLKEFFTSLSKANDSGIIMVKS